MSPYDDIEMAPFRAEGLTTPGRRYRYSASRRAAAGNTIWCWVVVITWLTLLGIGAGLVSWLCVHCQH